jgi:metal-responsive CopG/Arc/MetJ family transcriptional regulator
MKIKTSITLSDDVLAAVDNLAGGAGARSAFIERVLRRYVAARAHADARELARLNEAAASLNAEAADVLSYQTLDE